MQGHIKDIDSLIECLLRVGGSEDVHSLTKKDQSEGGLRLIPAGASNRGWNKEVNWI